MYFSFIVINQSFLYSLIHNTKEKITPESVFLVIKIILSLYHYYLYDYSHVYSFFYLKCLAISCFLFLILMGDEAN